MIIGFLFEIRKRTSFIKKISKGNYNIAKHIFFISTNEIVFECNGDPRAKRGETIYEILSLQQRFIRLESIQFENPNSPPTSTYGSISRPFSVVKVQQFPK